MKAAELLFLAGLLVTVCLACWGVAELLRWANRVADEMDLDRKNSREDLAIAHLMCMPSLGIPQIYPWMTEPEKAAVWAEIRAYGNRQAGRLQELLAQGRDKEQR